MASLEARESDKSKLGFHKFYWNINLKLSADELFYAENLISLMKSEHDKTEANIKNQLKATRAESLALEEDMKIMEEKYYALQQNYYRLRTVLEEKRRNQNQMKDLFESYEKRLLDEQERYKVLESNSAQELAR